MDGRTRELTTDRRHPLRVEPMPIDLLIAALSLVFLCVWALVGAILVRDV